MDGGDYDRAATAEADGAEQAFAALRAEVAALRRALEGMTAGLADPGRQEAPDYSPTLGVIARELKAVAARLEVLESRTTPAALGKQAYELRNELYGAGEKAQDELKRSQERLDGAVGKLEGLIRAARDRQDQQQWLWMVGGIGVMLGVLLWFMLPLVLPWSAGDWLSALPIGGGPFQAGASLMRRADPATWERMVRLYQACPADRATASCEAAMAARTRPPPPDRRAPGRHARAK